MPSGALEPTPRPSRPASVGEPLRQRTRSPNQRRNHVNPKPMVEIEGATHGVNDFVACLGYKGCVLKSDVTFDMSKNSTPTHRQHCEPWRVTLDDEKISPWKGWT